LVLDNFEQLLPEGLPALLALLDRVPDLACLITSRRRLQIPGEREFPLRPLAVPPAGASRRAVATCAGSRLFVERAHAANPAFAVTAGNAAAVAALCRELEGLPLALELAAVRASVLTPAEILGGVRAAAGRLRFLEDRDPERPERHRSLWTALCW